MRRIILLSALVILFTDGIAQSIIMARLDYTHIKNEQYQVNLLIDRSCDTCQSLNCLSDSLKIFSDSGTFYQPFIKDSSFQLHDLCTYTCGGNCANLNCGQITTTYRELYSTTIDLSQEACDVLLSITAGDRFSNYNNLTRPDKVWLYARMYRCNGPGNSAPSISVDIPYLYSNGGDQKNDWDILDRDSAAGKGDSFHFEWADPMRLPFVAALWQSPHTKAKSIEYLGFPSTYPLSSFPYGIHLDSKTGSIRYRPTKVGNYITALRVKEYRKGKLLSETFIERNMNIIDVPSSVNRSVDITDKDTITVPLADSLRLAFIVDGDNVDSFELVIANKAIEAQIAVDSVANGKLYGNLVVSGTGHKKNDIFQIKLRVYDPICNQRILFDRLYYCLVKGQETVQYSITPFGCDSFLFEAKPIKLLPNLEFKATIGGVAIGSTSNKKLLFKTTSIQTFRAEAIGHEYLIDAFDTTFNFDNIPNRYDTLSYTFSKNCYDYTLLLSTKDQSRFPDSIFYTYSGIPGLALSDTIRLTYRRQEPLILDIGAKARTRCYVSILDTLPYDSSDLEDYSFKNAIQACKGKPFTFGPTLRDTNFEVSATWKYLSDTTLLITKIATVDTAYEFVLVDRLGCEAGGRITVEVSDVPKIVLGNYKIFHCINGDTVKLSAKPEGGKWSGPGLIDTLGNTYFDPKIPKLGIWNLFYDYTTSEGCKAFDARSMAVFELPKVHFGVIDSSGRKPYKAYFFDSSDVSVRSWHWEFEDAVKKVSILRNPIFTFSDTGFYDIKLVVTDSIGCQDSVLYKDMIRVYDVGIRKNQIEFGIYPSPVDNILMLDLPFSGNTNYRVYSTTGQVLETGSLKNQSAISVASLPAGLYLLQLQNREKTGIKPFVKR